jgi:hypothetical protein
VAVVRQIGGARRMIIYIPINMNGELEVPTSIKDSIGHGRAIEVVREGTKIVSVKLIEVELLDV